MNPWGAPAHDCSNTTTASAFKAAAAAAGAGAPMSMFPGENMVVAVNAAKGVSPHALEWALSNVAQAGDHISLIALLHGGKHGKRIWGFPNFTGDCATRVSKGGNAREMEEEATDSCSSMMQQLHNLCYYKKVKVNVRVVPGATNGAIALEAQRVKATWVILDSQLRKEEAKSCMQQLQCNLVIVKRNGNDAKVQRLNLKAGSENGAHPYSEKNATTTTTISANAMIAGIEKGVIPLPHDVRGTGTLTASERANSVGSPGGRTPFTATEKGTSSTSSSEHFTSPLTSAEVGKICSGRNGGGHESLVIETDSASDYDPHDANSCDETSSDDASFGGIVPRRQSVLCRTAHASPDQQRTKICNVRHCRPSQQWGGDCNLTNVSQPESYTRMRTTNISSNSANVTPQMVRGHQRCTSTPASPLNFSKRFTGPPRLSSRVREGGIILHHGSLAAGRKENTFADEKQHYWHVQNKMGKSERLLGTQNFLDKYSTWEHDSEMIRGGIAFSDLDRTSSVRKAVFLSKTVPPGPPPLCSICQHKAPVFGKPPRRFTYAELELATGGFSQANFLAEGGFGCVHRGVLADGQAVAVKQHKLASTQGDIEFCSEVEVLSCAQHRNVVMLIGYCIEDKRRLLVYEFICNASLDSHLYGKDKGCPEWAARQKIAIGAARGLRYLHEECRVGCIVHRDMRPNNILLTHDFEPMVGDFGLARWQPDGDLGVQTRVIGTFGYLAPEYAQSGQITEKADVYSFGVVLLELATGRKAVDLTRPKGQQCLTEWARPLLDEHVIQDLVDPLLRGNYSEYEVYCMLHAASLCLRKDPNLRPRMSQVLRILEGDVVINTNGSSTACHHSSSKVRPNGARRRTSGLRHGMN